MSSEVQFLSWTGSLFHNLGANDAKDRSPKVLSLNFGTCSKPLLADLKDLVGVYAWRTSDK